MHKNTDFDFIGALTITNLANGRLTYDDFKAALLMPALKNLVAIPVNIDNSHWVVYLIDKPKRTIFFYDSLQKEGVKPKWSGIILEIATKVLETPQWEIKVINGFQQNNSFDCGVLCCQMVDFWINSENFEEKISEFKPDGFSFRFKISSATRFFLSRDNNQ